MNAPTDALENPARALVVHFGSPAAAALARNLGREQLRRWCLHGVPLERALDVEAKTHGAITAEAIVAYARARQKATRAAADRIYP